MEKLDLTKLYKSYYTAKASPEIIKIESANYLSIPGKGDPSDKLFLDKTQALYSVAYTLKFAYKSKNKDFTVAKLEGLWWFDEARHNNLSLSETPQKVPRSQWEYRLLIRLPDFVSHNEIEAAKNAALAKKGFEAITEVEYFELNEGLTVQMMHVGPFDKEIETLRIMSEMIKEKGFQKNGLHHEIYLSDFRKTSPEKLKTILREPVR
ncbi:MAG: GyrI-like domain-containing protein [Bacteroidota bacterium]